MLNKNRNSEIHFGYGKSQSFCFAANDTGSISLIKEFFRYKAVLVYKEWLFICHKRMSKRVRVNLLQYVSYRYKK